jgi:hypothetical protein
MIQKIFTANGNIVWADNTGACGNGGEGRSFSIVCDLFDPYVIGNLTAGWANCNYSGMRLVLMQMNASGTHVQYDTIRVQNVDCENIIKVGSDFVVSGFYSGPLTLGSTTLSGSAYPGEIFLAKFKKTSSPNAINSNSILNNDPDVYPNPSEGKFTINTKGESLIRVYDPFGKCVFRKTSNAADPTIDMSDKSKGVYVVEISSINERSVRRILIR